MDKENKLILYKDEKGRVSVNTRFVDCVQSTKSLSMDYTEVA